MEATARRESYAAKLFAFGTKVAEKYDWLIVVLVVGGFFGHLFTVQPVLLGLKQHAVPPIDQFMNANFGQFPWGMLLVDLVGAGAVFGVFSLSPAFLIWLERKVSGRIQSRPGPLHTGGWHGWLQTIADGIKLISKEDIIPEGADHILHTIGPILVVIAAAAGFVVIPFGFLIPGDFNIGVIYLLAVTSVGVFGIVIAGWASNNKYSLLGGMRSAAQLVSYEIPRGVALIGVIMLAGSVQMSEITNLQSGVAFDANGEMVASAAIPFVIYQPIAFVLFLIASIAESNRVPFDLPEAESELVAGFHTEYSGMKFGLFFVAEYANVVLFCCIAVALFLGGGSIPLLDGYLQYYSSQVFSGDYAFMAGFWHLPVFVMKTFVLVFFFLWVRWTYPRMRVDRLMDFSWKILLPWAFANLIFLGLAMVLDGGLMVFTIVNWSIVIYVLVKAKP